MLISDGGMKKPCVLRYLKCARARKILERAQKQARETQKQLRRQNTYLTGAICVNPPRNNYRSAGLRVRRDDLVEGTTRSRHFREVVE